LRLFHERTNDDDPSADRRDIKRASNSIAACQAQLPQLPFKVLDVRFAKAFKPGRSDTLRKSQKACLHVRRQGSDFEITARAEKITWPLRARVSRQGVGVVLATNTT
jgi:hypothetical protein